MSFRLEFVASILRQCFSGQPFPMRGISCALCGSILIIQPNPQRVGIMKGLALAGVVMLVLGILSFFVPFPHSEHHGIRVGDAHVGVTTEHDQRVPPALSVVLLVASAGLMIAGRKN